MAQRLRGRAGHANGLIPGFAGGAGATVLDGLIKGAGTGKSDSILAFLSNGRAIRVSNGESIVTAAATKKFWPVIKAMNDNKLPGFADGLVPNSSIFMRQPPSWASVQRTGSAQVVHQHIAVNAQGAILASDIFSEIQRTGIASVIGGSKSAQSDIADQRHQAIP